MGTCCQGTDIIRINSFNWASKLKSSKLKTEHEQIYVTDTDFEDDKLLNHNRALSSQVKIQCKNFQDRDKDEWFDELSEATFQPRKDSIFFKNDDFNTLENIIKPNSYNDEPSKHKEYLEQAKKSILKRYMLEVSKITNERKKVDRQRIIDGCEKPVLETLNDEEFKIEIFNPQMGGFKDFNDFKNLNEQIQMEYTQDEYESYPKIITSDQTQFFRTAIVIHKGRPVASGCLIVTEETFAFSCKHEHKKENDHGTHSHPHEEKDIKQIDDQVSPSSRKEVYRGVVTYLMMDQQHFRNSDPAKTISKLLQALEALAWLHNCIKMQIQMGTLDSKRLNQLKYWMVTRDQILLYNKNKEMGLKEMPNSTLDLIYKSNQESIDFYQDTDE